MKKHLFAYFNHVGSFFGHVITVEESKEQFIDKMTAGLPNAQDYVLESYLEDDLYYLGEFDSDTGHIFSIVEFCLHVGDTAKQILESRKKSKKSCHKKKK